MDNLTQCKRCSSDACYVDEVNHDIKTYFCYGCGFQTNSLMKDGEEFFTLQTEHLPELYKDLLYTDKDGTIWMPSAINVPDKGMVFANGTNKDEWKWTAVRAIERTEEEKKNNPKNTSDWKMDMSNQSHFGERDYMDALSYIGLLPE